MKPPLYGGPCTGSTPNIGTMLLANRDRFGTKPAFAERGGAAGTNEPYRYWTWAELVSDVERIHGYLVSRGLRPGDRVGFVSANGYARLVSELAVLSGGMVSVPIFAGYPKPLISELLEFAHVKLSFIDGQDSDSRAIGLGSEVFRSILDSPVRSVGSTASTASSGAWRAITPDALAFVMFTSGTSGTPKGVMLSHRNILSQQRALELLWKPAHGMRFLCYLPWHHSFGGLFERFFALHTGGCLAVDDSAGKNVSRLLQNFSEIRPHVYFSVPKVYQEIVSRFLVDREVERKFFHPDLKFVFTAAAPLPLATSAVFQAKGVPVVEGWGLTETSPCCTLTPLSTERSPGVVGFPIPGVELKFGDENEILVRGPNVMSGYLDRPEDTRKVLDAEGWFRTGDVGEWTENGLRLVSRKDRMFKLSNGEKIFPSVIEERIKARCQYVKHAYVWGQGLREPHVLVFPNAELFATDEPDTEASKCQSCSYPSCAEELASCLGDCIRILNETSPKIERVRLGRIAGREPTLENSELTPSFKLIPKAIERNFASDLALVERRLAAVSGETASEPLIVEVSSPEKLHYGVIGLGPIGAVLATHLAAAGRRVSLLVQREDRRRTFEKSEIRVTGALDAHARFSEVHGDLRSFLAGRPDVVMVATKSSDSPELYDQIRELAPDSHAVFVSCQNGLDVEDQIAKVFGSDRALRLVLNLGCRFAEPDHVVASFSYTHYLSLKDVEGGLTLPRAIAVDLTRAGFKVIARTDYRAEVFRKVLLNAALSPICAIAGVTMKAAMRDPHLSALVQAQLREGIAVAQAAGIRLREDFFERAVEYLSQGGDHKPSMLMDIEHGRRTENEDHGGRLCRYGREHQIPTPVTETLYQLLRSLENRSGKTQGGLS